MKNEDMKLLVTLKAPPKGTPEYEEWLDLNSEIIMLLGTPEGPASYDQESQTFTQNAKEWVDYMNDMLASTPKALAAAKEQEEALAALDDEDFSEFEENE